MKNIYKFVNNFLIVIITLLLSELRREGSLKISFFWLENNLPFNFNFLGILIFVSLLISFFSLLIDFLFRKILIIENSYFSILFINLSAWLIIFNILKIYEFQRLILLTNFIFYPLLFIYINKQRKIIPTICFLMILFLQINYSPIRNILYEQSFAENYENIDSSKSDSSLQNSYEDYNYNLVDAFKLSPRLSLKVFDICCDVYARTNPSNLPGGYLEIFKEYLILVNGNADIIFFNKNSIVSNSLIQSPKEIETNLEDIISNKNIFKQREETPKFESVRGVVNINDFLYISYIEEQNENCLNLEIVRAKLNTNKLIFSKFFQNEECLERSDEINVGQSGGKMVKVDDSYMLLSTGVWKDYSKPQDENSIFGKILKINLNNSKFQIVSLGHRNPQGLSETRNSGVFIETEHGDLGGDEINIINLNSYDNYGYPISSYGTHYDGLFREDAPLYDSHSDYGFKEPVYYFDAKNFPSHGISDIEINYFSESDSFFIATLNARRLYEATFDLENETIKDINTYSFDFFERIRDMKFDYENQVYFIFFEESPSLGVLSFNK